MVNMAWTILSPIEQSIKNKIETIGVPLKDWNIKKLIVDQLTGYNEAFIISEKNDKKYYQIAKVKKNVKMIILYDRFFAART